MKRIDIKTFILPYIVILTLLAGCNADLTNELAFKENENAIAFGVSLEEIRSVSTRAEGEEVFDNGLDSMYVAHDPWNEDFYIQLNTINANNEIVTKYGVYVVPSAYEGRLESKNPAKALDWQNLNNDHTFYSWTIPWMKTAPDNIEGNDVSDADNVEGEEQYYTPSDNELTVNFYNSSEANGFALHENNAILEKFIGAKSQPYSYTGHGKYVDLTFYHLVSKIRVDGIILIKSDGSVQENLQADMTFVGMPTQATFYPHPKPEDESGAPENSRPYVGKPWTNSSDEGVTYFIWNKAGVEDLFYICPEVDFSKIDYQIKITSDGYQNTDIYYGTFDDVIFERKSGWGHDIGEDDTGEIVDSKILHAGEEMSISITLIPGIGPGLKIIISDWSTDKPIDSQYHTHQGFYSDAEIQQFIDLMFGLNSDTYDNPPSELEFLFEMYGYEKDGKKYFPLYENLAPQKGNTNSNIFPVPKGYIIDGMGHTVTLKTNNGNYFGTGRNETYYNIGPCVDIYLSDPNGNNTIYIDPEGYVWITNKETGVLEQTDNKLPELTGNYKGYDISADSGKIRLTEYFNDNIVG